MPSNHVVKHRNGWRYLRHIPSDARPLIGRAYWSEYLGQISYPAAVKIALQRDVANDAVLANLKKLTAEQRADILTVGTAAARMSGVKAAKPIEEYLKVAESVTLDDAWAQVVNDFAGTLRPDDNLPDDELALQLVETHQWQKQSREIIARKGKQKRIAATVTGVNDAKLMPLVDLWQANRKPRNEKTVDKARLYVRRFVEVCGDIAPKDVTRKDANNFRDTLDDADTYARGTVNLHLEKLHTLFGEALASDRFGVNFNPFTGVKSRLAVNEDDDKKPFTLDQVQTLFSALPTGSEIELVTRILAYHGARSSEICQLTVADITALHGIDAMRIHGRNGSVKTVSRDVPIHPECVDAIKAQVVNITAKDKPALAPDGSPWLFPDTVCTRPKASRGHDYQLSAGRLLRSAAKITDPKLTLHSLRHTFRDICRELDMPEPVSQAIMGHAGKGAHAKYGKGVSLKKRAEWLLKVDLSAD